MRLLAAALLVWAVAAVALHIPTPAPSPPGEG